VVAEVRAALATADVGLWGSLSRLLIGRREPRPRPAAPNREAYLNDFVRNRVYYRLRQRLAAERRRLGRGRQRNCGGWGWPAGCWRWWPT
jgi:hypothetical protein